MAHIWLRLELFELGLLPLPSKYAATLTLSNVKKALDAVHKKCLTSCNGLDAVAGEDAVMLDTEGGFTESDNLNVVTFGGWKEAVDDTFRWREQDYKAFWLLLVQFHRMIPVKKEVADESMPLDVEQCLEREEVPVFKVAILLFIQTVKPHSWRTKYSLKSYNAVWYREHADNFVSAAGLETAPTAASTASPRSPLLGALGSPHMRGGASPPPPQSPHAVGMADRSTADSYYLAFVREKLEDLFGLLYPSVDLKEDSSTVVSADQVDLLAFLLCLGDASLVDKQARLSSCYPTWEQSDDGGAMSDTEAAKEFVPLVDNGAKVCRFFKTHLSLNEKMYPPVGYSVAALTMNQKGLSTPSPPAFSLNDDFSLDGIADTPVSEKTTTRPFVLSQLTKTTMIKCMDEFVVPDDARQHPDLIIFSCQDSTNVTISACKNCRIVTAPSAGILLIERCENVQLTCLSGLIRVSNCLDTRLNAYTLSPIIVSGENLGVILGPYNTKYSGLKQQLSTMPFLYNVESHGCWSMFLNLDDEKDSMSITDKPLISLQLPETFRDTCVPVKSAGGVGSAERPFPIPPEYVAVVRKQHETVESLRQLVTSNEFDLTTKRTMEMVIQLKFKEWLSATSNVRQILDLVHLDLANESISKESQ
uniref:C-CAP/cofactor C-like domain-containing protein n=1 Tax=Peronospora matthiolae TaxID=2874970 RepID=A0AAV1U7D2_9STRA